MELPKTTVYNVISVGLILILFLSSALSKDQPTSPLQWGTTVDGLQMSISVADSHEANVPEFEVSLRNVGEQDVTLNLGTMLANGKAQLPQSISLIFTDGSGKMRRFRFAHPKYRFVAGRVDDYIVPLRVDSIYALKLRGDQFWSPESKDYGLKLSPGKYHIVAEFEGRGATRINLDMPGIKLMNFWQGRLQSNVIAVER
jgi:hypothetical protein